MKIKSINLNSTTNGGGERKSVNSVQDAGANHRLRESKLGRNISMKDMSKGTGRKPMSRLELAMQNSPRNQIQAFLKDKKFGRFGKGLSPERKKKLKKVLLLLGGLFLISGTIGGLWFFSYLQKLDRELPSVDNPFGDREVASVMYDRNGKELYKLYDEFNRDPLDITTVPAEVKWAFLAAEDIDFYTHQGFDPAAIIRCALLNVRSGGISCGGSTITQQMVKITIDQTQATVERKLKEVLFSIKVEQAYTKDEILQLYLSVVPFGGNIYGLPSAAEFYFAKEPKDLTLAEAAILASIIQNPYYLSPTKGPDTTDADGNVVTAKEKVKVRQEYVLDQIRGNMAKINNLHRDSIEDPEADDLFTEEMIEAALNQELAYQPDIVVRRSGHAVDYALQLLQERNYNKGEEPFTISQLQTGGYKIYLTIDYDLQQIADQSVRDAVATYGPVYGFANSAVITTKPSTGEIITMAGSKDYNGQKEGCDANGQSCTFDPQVNITATNQSPGSSTKPFGTYEAYRIGRMFPGSLLPDVPIEVGGGFSIKNWNSTFFGVTDKTTAGQMLRESRNLPAIEVLQVIGIPRFLEVMREFGYTTYGDDSQYGPSVILGGSDVKPVEHAQGYGVFANGGQYVQHEIILKIEDRLGNVIYEHKPELQKVADEKATYLLNNTLLNNNGVNWDSSREVSAKSGTSENNRDVWMAVYSPDFVTIGWSGNNNNNPMTLNAFGETIVVPWLRNYMRQIADAEYFAARTPFPRPGGIVNGGGCTGECIGSFTGLVSGLMIEGVEYPVDNIRTKIRVCTDQPSRLARPIDEALGLAADAVAIQYIMPSPEHQQFLDRYLQDQANQGKGQPNGGPKEFCDIDRTGGAIDGPFAVGLAAQYNAGGPTVRISGNAYTTAGNVTRVEFYFDCNTNANCVPATKLIGQVNTTRAFDSTLPLPAGVVNGQYTVAVKIFDDQGQFNTQTVRVNIGVNGGVDPAITVGFDQAGPWVYGTNIGPGNNRTISVAYPGNPQVVWYVQKNGAGDFQNAATAGKNWTWNGNPIITNENANYRFFAHIVIPGTLTGRVNSATSAAVQVNQN